MLAALAGWSAPASRREAMADRLGIRGSERDLIAALPRLVQELRGRLEAGRGRPSLIHAALRGAPVEAALLARAADRRGEALVDLYFESLEGARTILRGGDLERLGVPAGPERRRILDLLLAARLDGCVGSRDEELALARGLAAGGRSGRRGAERES